MVKREILYDAFGELLYSIAKADGSVQNVEIDTLQKLIKEYNGRNNIEFNFNYDLAHSVTLNDAYEKAIQVCIANGPDPEYIHLINMMIEVAKAYMGIVPAEKKLLEKFVSDLKVRFLSDFYQHQLI